METLAMSSKERRRLTVMAKVKSGELKLCRAAQAMGVSYRHAKRIWKRYETGGDRALVHRSRGKEGSRRITAGKREKILKLFEKEYRDFGPTLAAEYLEQKGLEVDHETLRRWLIARQLWTGKRRRQKRRQWRERRACFGEMVRSMAHITIGLRGGASARCSW
jgi:molybdenum-dependent DNA-binding transcriptional regulator ModE